MKLYRTLALIPLVVVFAALSHGSQHERAFECGAIFHSQTTFDDLVQTFGASNVIEAEIHEDEGFHEIGALIFPGSHDEVEVFWHDPQTRQSLRKVRITGESSSWKVPSGLELGMELQSIEALNRVPFRLAGFDFDYGGTITSWENGHLEHISDRSCRLVVRLGADFSKVPWERIVEHGNVQGDRIFSSGHPTMQLLNPTVREFSLFLE